MMVFQYITGLNDGGAETLVKDYALKMKDDGYVVKIVVTFLVPNTANYKLLKDNGIEIISLYRRWSLPNRIAHRLFPGLITARKFMAVVQKYHPNVIHVHMALLRTLIPIRKHLKGIKLFYTCHSEPNRYLGARMPREHNATIKLIQSNNLQIIALHDDMRQEINEMLQISNTIVVNNGVDFKRFLNNGESKASIRHSIGIPEKSFVLGHVGRFSEPKNHRYLIKVFKEVQDRDKNSFLLLIGTGPLERRVKNQLKQLGIWERSLILSHRTDIPRLLKAMDIFVFPSLYEGFGTALIEAQLSGLRCVISTKVNRSVFVTDNAIPMDISVSPVIWAKEILNPQRKGIIRNNIDEYDLGNVIKQLEALYIA